MHRQKTLIPLLVLSFVALPCVAMKKEDVAQQSTTNNFIIKTFNVTVNINELEPLKVPLRMKVLTPVSAQTDEAKNAYYQTFKGTYLSKLQEVLKVYEDQFKKPSVGNHFVTILPTELFFDPEANRFTIKCHWPTEHVSDTVRGELDTRMECVYAHGQLVSQDPLLDITYEETKQKESITINRLFNMFPVKAYLNFNPDNIQENHKKIIGMAFQRALGIQQGKNIAELPDPKKYEDALHLADLKKMVTHYLSTKK